MPGHRPPGPGASLHSQWQGRWQRSAVVGRFASHLQGSRKRRGWFGSNKHQKALLSTQVHPETLMAGREEAVAVSQTGNDQSPFRGRTRDGSRAPVKCGVTLLLNVTECNSTKCRVTENAKILHTWNNEAIKLNYKVIPETPSPGQRAGVLMPQEQPSANGG